MLPVQSLKIYLFLAVIILENPNFSSATSSDKFQATEAKIIPPLTELTVLPPAILPEDQITSNSLQESSGGLQSRIIPKLVDSFKYVYNFMVTPRQTGTSKSEDSGHHLTNVFGIFAFITFFSFLIFVLQPLVTYPKRRRIALSQGRRFRHYFSPGYPYNPRSFPRKPKHVTYISTGPSSVPGVSYYTSAGSNVSPVQASGPGAASGSFPVISAFPATGPSSIVYSKDQENALASNQVRTVSKHRAPNSVKNAPPLQPHEEKLTKEEILYILKTLDEDE